jgi:hypothetical protein
MLKSFADWMLVIIHTALTIKKNKHGTIALIWTPPPKSVLLRMYRHLELISEIEHQSPTIPSLQRSQS